MIVIVGKCPKCGCPIYQEEYSAGYPAPAIYICKCYQEKDIDEPLVEE